MTAPRGTGKLAAAVPRCDVLQCGVLRCSVLLCPLLLDMPGALADETPALLPEVSVSGQRESIEGERTGFSVGVVNVENVTNSSVDLNEVIKRTPGVVLRETGRLGSSFELSLNGLWGQQVRYDAVVRPVDGAGQAALTACHGLGRS